MDAIEPAPVKFFEMEVLWCAFSRRQHQIPQSGTRIGADDVMPSAFVCDLGIYIDADVSMRTHVAKTVSSCFAVQRHLRSIRRSVSKPVFGLLCITVMVKWIITNGQQQIFTLKSPLTLI